MLFNENVFDKFNISCSKPTKKSSFSKTGKPLAFIMGFS